MPRKRCQMCGDWIPNAVDRNPIDSPQPITEGLHWVCADCAEETKTLSIRANSCRQAYSSAYTDLRYHGNQPNAGE